MATVAQFQRSEYAARLRASGNGNSGKISPAQRGVLRQFIARNRALNGTQNLRAGSMKTTRETLQQSVVKVSYRSSKYPGQWEAHGKYLEREGAQQEGNKGKGFNATQEEAEIASVLKSWQAAQDEHMFRLIVSPEQGERMDMREHTRQLIGKMEQDLGTKLQWVAIDHNNTDNPHVHIALRGRDDKGGTLVMPKHYIQQGIRQRSREMATRELGMRKEHDIVSARDKSLQAKRLTELDRVLDSRKNAQGRVQITALGTMEEKVFSRQLLSRLQFLREIGLANKVGSMTWQLSENFVPALRQYQNSQDIVKRRGQHMSNIMDTRAPLAITSMKQIQERNNLTGRVVGFGLDDALEDRRYLLLEATDGRVHYMALPKGMEKRLSEQSLTPGDLITLKARAFEKAGSQESGEGDKKQTIRYIAVENNGKANTRDILPLDRDIVSAARTGTSLHIKGDGLTKFQAHYNELVQDRMRHLQAVKVLGQDGKVNEQLWKDYRDPAKNKENDKDMGR